ncbi:MAG: diguanylate cyclase [Bradyrhizobium sp.]|uniref:diguanylate cyclase domain-containing protein n=1 Tax=Bradyrhizobium sp. TaxID=376 RepID=UPI003C7A85EE
MICSAHAADDLVLQTVTGRVTAVLGKDQIMARLGGDEFAILMPGPIDPAAASKLAESILEALNAKSDSLGANHRINEHRYRALSRRRL